MIFATINHLCLNKNKSKAIINGEDGLLPNVLPLLVVGVSPIALIQCAKDLAIIYNSQLSWTNHANQKIYVLINIWHAKGHIKSYTN